MIRRRNGYCDNLFYGIIRICAGKATNRNAAYLRNGMAAIYVGANIMKGVCGRCVTAAGKDKRLWILAEC